jgi:hypothetical protein
MYETDAAAEVVEEILQEEVGTGEYESYENVGEGPQGEADLAGELLELSTDHELDQFFGKLVKGVSKFAKSPMGKMLVGTVKGLAKKALPLAGSIAGNIVAPGVGGMIGGNVAGALGSALGLEGEGLVAGEEEFEVAKRVVRVTQQAAGQLAQDPRVATDPRGAVKSAVANAVRTHLPGLAGGDQASIPGGVPVRAGTGGRSGRWVRRGHRIILLGV